MSRYFSKTGSSDYLEYATPGRLSEFLNGAAKVSLGIWIKADVLTNTSTSDGVVVRIFIEAGAAGSGAGIAFNTSNGVTNVIRTLTQSQAADAVQIFDSLSSISTGVWYHVGIVCDYPNDTVRIYINGVQDAIGVVSWGATSYTDANNQTNTDGFSSNGSNLNHHWSGQMAEFALWIDDIGSDGFAALAKGVSPALVNAEKLVAYLPMIRDLGDVCIGDVVSIVGSVPVSDHPRVFYPKRSMTFKSVAAGGGGGGGSAIQLSLLGVG